MKPVPLIGCVAFRRRQLLYLVSLALVFVSVAEANLMNLFPRELLEEGIQLSAARMLGGDFTQLNELISGVTVPIPTEALSLDAIDVGFGVTAEITLGDGYCENVQFRPEGDIQVLSGFGDLFTDPIDSTVYERIFLELSVLALMFKCSLEMEIRLFLLGIPLSGNNGGPGTLVLKPAEDGTPPGIFLDTSLDVFSEDFSDTPPVFSNSTGCNADISKIDYSESTNLGNAILVGDITSIVVGVLEGDPSLVEAPIKENLCGLLENVTILAGDLLVNNPLTNATVKESDILGAENALPPPSTDVDLLDWGDNFVTNLIFPENGTSDTLDNLLEGRSIGELIGGFLDIDIGENGIDNLDLMPLLGPLINEDYDPSLPLLSLSNLLNISSLNVQVYVENLFLSTTKLDIDLNSLSFPGELTITLPTVDLGDIDVLANIRLVVTLDEISFGDIVLSGLALDESFSVALDWDSFTLDASIFVPVNLAVFPSLQFGGLTTNTLTCLLSTLYVSPMVTSLDIGTSGIGLQISGFQDAILFIVGDIINNVFPVLEGAIKLFLDATIDNSIENQELLEVPTCPAAKIEDDAIPYDFSRGIFKTISDFVTKELVEQAAGLLVGMLADDNSTILTLIDGDGGISFSISLQGQSIDFGLYHLGVFGLRPPTIREFVLLFADPTSIYFPQELVNSLKAASEVNPIGATIKFTLDFSGKLVANNDISITISLSAIEAALDIFAKLSKYDVDSITLENIINIDCWVAGLENPGGVLDLALFLGGLDIDTSCDCESVPLKQVFTALATPKAIAVISDFINSLLNVLEYIVESPYAPENWDLTIKNAKRSCNGLEPLPSEIKLLNPPVKDLSIPQALGGLLVVAVNIAVIVSCCFKKKKKGYVVKQRQEESHMTSLFESPKLPIYVRVGFPLLILSNIAMFIAGDLDTALIVNVNANVAGVPLSLDGIATLSVVSSTEQLLNVGAVGLAILLIVLVLLWPYLKLASMLATWFLPPSKLSPKNRSYVLDLLDVLGKWSFVEFFFVSFLLLSLGVEIENPDFGFNPPDAELLSLNLELIMQRGLFLFVSAILFSMILSNISIFLDARTHPSLNRAGAFEKEGFSVAYTGFHNEHTTGPDDDFIQTTWLGRVVFSTTILANVLLILALVHIPLVETEFMGLIGILKGLENGPEDVRSFSISELISFTLLTDTGDYGYIFLGIVTVVIAIIMPVVQQAHLIYIFFVKRTAAEAYHSIRVNKILISWCCLEVFTLALVVSALEVRFVSKSFVKEECSALVEPITILANSGFLDPEDGDAVCFGVKGKTSPLVFLFIVTIVLYKCTSFLVLSLLETSASQHKAGAVDTVEASHHHPWAYKIMRFLQLVRVSSDPEFTKGEALSFSNVAARINERNARNNSRVDFDSFPMEQEQTAPPLPSRARNPVYSEASQPVYSEASQSVVV